MAEYWNASAILAQTAGELGLPQLATIASVTDVQAIQLVSLLNAAGNDLLLFYPWQQFSKEWTFNTSTLDPVTGDIDLPTDWSYFRDQTQWDRSNHWPLLGPKSPQEWAWLKGSLVAALPRQRYRVADGKFKLWPIPADPYSDMAMEYVSQHWVIQSSGLTPASMVIADADEVLYNPWLMVKFLKLKFYELKGFPTDGVRGDFMRLYNSLTGKDVGGAILSLAPRPVSQFLDYRSIPDGNWGV
jgi:hypothetical protein